MDKKQMEMLSVKNTIERLIGSYIAAFYVHGDTEVLVNQVRIAMSALFVGQQVRAYNVRFSRRTAFDIDIITFDNQHSTLTFLLEKKMAAVGSDVDYDPFYLTDDEEDSDTDLQDDKWSGPSWPFPVGAPILDADDQDEPKKFSQRVKGVNFIKNVKEDRDSDQPADPIKAFDDLKKIFT